MSKHWTKLGADGRDFLIEEVPFVAISNAVQMLPLHASASPAGAGVEHLAALEPLLPREVASIQPPATMQVAQSMPDQAGVVLDYTEFDWAEITTSYEFQQGTTYYINGSLILDQTPVFDGGTVIKFESSYAGCGIQNYGGSYCAFNGSICSPVTFTSSDDNSIGDSIADSSGSPGTGQSEYINESWPCCFSSGVTIAGVSFSLCGDCLRGRPGCLPYLPRL